MSGNILYYAWIASYFKRNPGGATGGIVYTTTAIPQAGEQLYASDLSFSSYIDSVYIDGNAISCNYDAIGEIETTSLTRSAENDIYEATVGYTVRDIDASTFKGNGRITNVDCVNLPWVNNSMSSAFQGCCNLVSVTNINLNVTNMYSTFKSCTELIEAPIIPNSVVNASSIYYGCTKLTNSLTLPATIENLSHGFSYCSSLANPPVIPNSVTNLAYTFSYCTNLVTCPNITNNVINLDGMYKGCTNINSVKVSIPHSVTNMNNTFEECTHFSGDVYIYSNQITGAMNCFNNTTLTKNVYIPFTYLNGINTATYNAFTQAGYDEIGTKDGVYLKVINIPIRDAGLVSDSNITQYRDAGFVNDSNLSRSIDAGLVIEEIL